MRPLSTNQQIAVWGIVVPSVISLLGIFLQGRQVDNKIQPVLELKPVITNVINNVTKVEKEIANLKDAVKQQYGLWESESFGMHHLDIKVKRLNRPATAPKTNASFVFVELNKIPLANSVQVSTERGVVPPSAIRNFRNVLRIKYLGLVDDILAAPTNFLNVRYIPDWESTEGKFYSLEGSTLLYECDPQGECNTQFTMALRQPEAQPAAN